MKHKRLFSSIIVTFLLLSLSVQAFGGSISDIDQSAGYAKESIIKLFNEGIIYGDENGNFNPKDIVTRSEMVAFIVRVLDINTEVSGEENTFKDVPSNHWSYKYIEAAYREGIIKGISVDEFGRDNLCTREQMAAMFIRALNIVDTNTNIEFKNINTLSDKEKIASWAKREVELTLGTGLMNGVSRDEFAPKDYAKREQVAVVVDRFITNKDIINSKISSEYGVSKGLSIDFNGDNIKFDNAIDDNGTILVPMEFFDEYVFASMYPSYDKDSNTIYIEQHLKDDYYQLYLKEGISRAYKYKTGVNFKEIPFKSEENYKEAMVEFSMAPRVVNNTLYVPIGDMLNILDIEYSYNQLSNKLTISDDRIVKYPSLYYTVKKDFYKQYKGEMEVEGYLIQKLEDGTNMFTMEYMIDSAMNETNGYGRGVYAYDEINEEPYMYDLEEIAVGDKYYLRNYGDTNWFEFDRSYVLENGDSILLSNLEEKDKAFDVVTSSNFYDKYNKFPTTRVGTEYVDGKSVAKYRIELNSDDIINLLPEENYEENKEIIKAVYKDSIKYIIEFYVKDDEMVKQFFNFYGEVSDPEGENKQILIMEMNTRYDNINVDIEVLPPSKENIISE